MQISLARLPAGIPATVVRIGCDKKTVNRLRDFGLIPGTTVMICYRSPSGGVAALQCRGAIVALRTNDLRHISVRWG